MRHRIHHRKLNRTSEHRRALHRNLAQSLIEHGRITTTVPKAKDLQPFVEKLVTLAVRTRRLTGESDTAGALRARRAIYKALGDRSIVPKEHLEAYAEMSNAGRAKTLRMGSGRRYRTGEPKGRLAFTGESVMHRLIEGVAPRYEERPGGYTRLIHLPTRRVGDFSQLAMLQFVGDEEAPVSLTKPPRSARRRKADSRYAMAVKRAKQWSKEERAAKGKTEAADETAVDAAEDPKVDPVDGGTVKPADDAASD